MIALKACPNCSDEFEEVWLGRFGLWDYYVACDTCGLRAPVRGSREEAADSWNELVDALNAHRNSAGSEIPQGEGGVRENKSCDTCRFAASVHCQACGSETPVCLKDASGERPTVERINEAMAACDEYERDQADQPTPKTET